MILLFDNPSILSATTNSSSASLINFNRIILDRAGDETWPKIINKIGQAKSCCNSGGKNSFKA